MAAYALDDIVINVIKDSVLLSNVVDKRLVWWFGEPLLRIQDNLNSNCYTGEVLESEALRLLQAKPYFIIHQDNVRPHVIKILQAFFEKFRVSQVFFWTSLEYDWSATCSSWSPNSHSCRFMDLHTISVEEIPQEHI